jgi:hypothetical protein
VINSPSQISVPPTEPPPLSDHVTTHTTHKNRTERTGPSYPSYHTFPFIIHQQTNPIHLLQGSITLFICTASHALPAHPIIHRPIETLMFHTCFHFHFFHHTLIHAHSSSSCHACLSVVDACWDVHDALICVAFFSVDMTRVNHAGRDNDVDKNKTPHKTPSDDMY